MNRINSIENEEIKNPEAGESHFDDEWHKELMDKIRDEKAKQKERDLAQVSGLNELLLKDEKMPINNFIEKYRKEWLNEEEIAKKLILQWYSRREIMASSINDDIKKEGEIAYQYNGFRFKNIEDFYEQLWDIIKEALTKGTDINNAMKNIPVRRIITIEDIKNLKKLLPNPDNNVRIDLSGEILPDLDWSKSKEVLYYIHFDDKTFSNTLKEHLPEWFNPETIFRNWKTIGLWIDTVHKMWYTWKGVSVAICDWQLKPHKDIKTKEYSVEKNAGNFNGYFHASAVSSILAWKQTGIAPDTDLYFFAGVKSNEEKNGGQDLASSLNKILEKNEKLSDDKKIRVISISWPLYWWEKTEKLVKKLEESWVWVLHSGEFWQDFWYLEKKDPMWDPNDFTNYQHYLWLRSALFVNSGSRTLADPKNDNAYRHDTQASASWAIPVVAWYYALACQADPTMTPEKFKKLARETAHEIDSTISYPEDDKRIRSTETRKIKVIDIKALIQKIEWREK